jgi:mycofactocin glycosyltransferase
VKALPAGFGITLDRRTRQIAPGVWSGGSPTRLVRLSRAGRFAMRRLLVGSVDSRAAGVLARHLTDAGMAHPCPPSLSTPLDVTVMVPVRDRAALLDGCLAALGRTYPVVVVDDGSRRPDLIEAVAARHGATLVRRAFNGGPAAARNTGLDHVSTAFVAFVDSDCAADPGWIDQLAGHFADPLVGAVAPRVVSFGDRTGAVTRLDLGDQPARVAPNTRVSYVPTAALIARCAALKAVARPAGIFDPAMRVGEDVDLVWRLHDGGWRIRYEPSVQVGHHEPATMRGLLTRRWQYGTSAAPLALRHPRNIPPLVLDPWSTVTVAALLGRRPVVAGAAFAVSVLRTSNELRRHGLPTSDAWRVKATAAAKTWLGLARYATQFASPLLVALMLPGGQRRWGRRAATASLLLGPPLVAWAAGRPAFDPIRYATAAVADDVAYGTGVWAGCVKHRTATPLRPVMSRRVRA